MKNRCCESGFSLIELLIASLIVASAGTMLASGILLANRSGAIRIQQAVAAHVLADELARVDDRLTAGTEEEHTVPSPDGNLTVVRASDAAEPPLAPLIYTSLRINHPRVQAHVATCRRPAPES